MATTITKVKRKTPQAPLKKTTKADAGSILADEYGTAQDRVKREAAPITEAFEAVKAKLKAFMAANHQPTDETVLEGDLYKLEVGICAKAPAKVKDGAYVKVREMVGEEVFFKLVKITLEDLRAYLTPEQLAEVLEPEEDQPYTEKRSVKVVAVAPPAK